MRTPRSKTVEIISKSKYKEGEVVMANFIKSGSDNWIPARVTRIYAVMDELGQPYLDVQSPAPKNYVLVKCPTRFIRKATKAEENQFKGAEHIAALTEEKAGPKKGKAAK